MVFSYIFAHSSVWRNVLKVLPLSWSLGQFNNPTVVYYITIIEINIIKKIGSIFVYI